MHVETAGHKFTIYCVLSEVDSYKDFLKFFRYYS